VVSDGFRPWQSNRFGGEKRPRLKMKRHEFTLKIQKFVDAPFALGDKTKGWDCLNSLDDFYRSIGKDFPEEYKGVNKDNYAEKWKSRNGKKLFREFLLSLGSKIDPNYMIEGDLFVFDGENFSFPAIYLGRSHLLTVWDKGIKVVPLKAIKRLFKLADVRRL
jgi:hypothetical protein